MNMNREAVNIALGLAGNMPLTDDDKRYNNLVYVFCKQLYLPTLFNALSEIDWRCARKEEILIPSRRWVTRKAGSFYYEIPADCVRPLMVDNNETAFYNDTNFIITEQPARKLYYVFHRRQLPAALMPGAFAGIAGTAREREDAVVVHRPDNDVDEANPRAVIRRPETDAEMAAVAAALESEDFPEWEYTPYDADFWTYFSYKLAAVLVPKLRADDGAAGRAQALEAIARQKGAEATQRSRASSTNPKGRYKSWAEKCGLVAAGSSRLGW